MGPLTGVKVLDLSRVLAGPWATQALADFGATVFKLEKPGAGDDTRSWGPPWLADRDGHPTGQAAYYLACNRGKHSVAIDLASPEGQSLVRRLAQRAGVPAPDLLLDYRIRSGWTGGAGRRLRSGDSGHERADEHHRRRRGRAGCRPAARPGSG